MPTVTRMEGLTENQASAGVSAGTTSTITTATATNATISGKFATSYSATSNAASPTTDATTGLPFNALQPNQCCSLVIGINAAGALAMSQGPISPTLVGVTTTVGGFLNAPQFPAVPDNFVALAYTVVRTAPSAAAWTPGTSSWTASGVSASTFQNVAVLPNRPAIS